MALVTQRGVDEEESIYGRADCRDPVGGRQGARPRGRQEASAVTVVRFG